MASGGGTMVKHQPHYPKVEGSSLPTATATWAQCYKTFYRGNLLPFHGHTITLCYKVTLPW